MRFKSDCFMRAWEVMLGSLAKPHARPAVDHLAIGLEDHAGMLEGSLDGSEVLDGRHSAPLLECAQCFRLGSTLARASFETSRKGLEPPAIGPVWERSR